LVLDRRMERAIGVIITDTLVALISGLLNTQNPFLASTVVATNPSTLRRSASLTSRRAYALNLLYTGQQSPRKKEGEMHAPLQEKYVLNTNGHKIT